VARRIVRRCHRQSGVTTAHSDSGGIDIFQTKVTESARPAPGRRVHCHSSREIVMRIANVLRFTGAVIATVLVAGTAHAQLFRAYLSPTGLDTNPCTLPAPCRLLRSPR
jgi:hypothetical protein